MKKMDGIECGIRLTLHLQSIGIKSNCRFSSVLLWECHRTHRRLVRHRQIHPVLSSPENMFLQQNSRVLLDKTQCNWVVDRESETV